MNKSLLQYNYFSPFLFSNLFETFLNICYFQDIPFPAITICSVNKVERERLIKSIKGIVAVQNATNAQYKFNSTMDLDAIGFMIESLVRYDKVNFSDPYWQWVSKNSPKIKSSDLLKLFRWVSNNQIVFISISIE